VDASPLHIKQVSAQSLQVLVGVSLYFFAGQTESQVIPSKKLLTLHEEHDVLVPSVQTLQKAWHFRHLIAALSL
jgi:hypothetical protein